MKLTFPISNHEEGNCNWIDHLVGYGLSVGTVLSHWEFCLQNYARREKLWSENEQKQSISEDALNWVDHSRNCSFCSPCAAEPSVPTDSKPTFDGFSIAPPLFETIHLECCAYTNCPAIIRNLKETTLSRLVLIFCQRSGSFLLFMSSHLPSYFGPRGGNLETWTGLQDLSDTMFRQLFSNGSAKSMAKPKSFGLGRPVSWVGPQLVEEFLVALTVCRTSWRVVDDAEEAVFTVEKPGTPQKIHEYKSTPKRLWLPHSWHFGIVCRVTQTERTLKTGKLTLLLNFCNENWSAYDPLNRMPRSNNDGYRDTPNGRTYTSSD